MKRKQDQGRKGHHPRIGRGSRPETDIVGRLIAFMATCGTTPGPRCTKQARPHARCPACAPLFPLFLPGGAPRPKAPSASAFSDMILKALRLAGADHSALLGIESPIAFVVTRMEIDFQRPARIDDALTVTTTYDSVRGARFTIAQRLSRGEEPVAVATLQVASIDLQGRPRRPPPELMAKLEPFLLADR
jgi:acyl-CoA thioesterase FadM